MDSEKQLSANCCIRVFLDSLSWFIRPNNTDWRYTKFNIPRLVEYVRGIQIYQPSSKVFTTRENAAFAFKRLLERLSRSSALSDICFSGFLDAEELRRSNCDIVFSHRSFPENAADYPVIWQNSILDPNMQLAYGATESQIETEVDKKRPLFEKASVVQVSTKAEAIRLSGVFPHLSNRFFPVPFFLPDTIATTDASVEEKHVAKGRIHVLFVGNEAKRKGLDSLLTAFMLLPRALRRMVKLSIVTSFQDGPIRIPPDDSIELLGSISHSKVMQLMNVAHIFAMPSKFESYGLVYIEAMSCGTVPVAPNFEVQREIVENGAAGLTTSGDPRDLSQILQMLIEDRATRTKLAISARNRFTANFAPNIVAQRYLQMFKAAAGKALLNHSIERDIRLPQALA